MTRRKQSTAAEVQAIINEIIDLMTKSKWTTASADKLAAAHNLQSVSVRRHAAEASRQIKLMLDDSAHEMGAAFKAQIVYALEQCLVEKKWSAFFRGVDIQARIHGLYAPTRELSGDLALLSDEDLEVRRQQLIAQLQQAKPGKP